MRRLGFRILLFVVGAALVVFFLFTHDSNTGSGSVYGHNFLPRGTNARIMEETSTLNARRPKNNLQNFDQEDYPHFDPTPSSKASIKHGPIEHGTPLMPFIPQPAPPPTRFGSGAVTGSGAGPVSADEPVPSPPHNNQ